MSSIGFTGSWVVGWAIGFVDLLGSCVTHRLDKLYLIRKPLIERDRFDFRDVGAKTSMNTRAADADVDTKIR